MNGVSGILFSEQTTDSLIAAIQIFLATDWNQKAIQKHADKWNTEQFDQGILDVVKSVL